MWNIYIDVLLTHVTQNEVQPGWGYRIFCVKTAVKGYCQVND